MAWNPNNFGCRTIGLILPVGYKKVGITTATIVAVTAEDQFFTVRGKHGESIKYTFAGNFLQIASITVYHIQLKIITALPMVIA